MQQESRMELCSPVIKSHFSFYAEILWEQFNVTTKICAYDIICFVYRVIDNKKSDLLK